MDDTTTDRTTDKDRALIALLRENARAPVAEIARRLGVSRTTAQSRIERLERAGIVVGYGARLSADYEAGLVRAHVMIVAAPKLTPAVTKALAAMPEVRRLLSVSGAFDMIAEVAAESVAVLDAVIDRIGTLDGVERTQTSVVLSTRFER
ncbi:Lrp/AsnC family transcriptional regulator [Salinarimonas sp. NSM]|uniref:Lrp/AsnC family transcriptional regulator n=1 Tax=Salinarimonas sp. NSM TaxID=3458003 RepID=UPI0040354648